MIFRNPYWTLETKLDLLARWIIVHSIIYYELNTSIVPDHVFDSNSRLFVVLVDDNRSVLKNTRYGYVMKDFDGSSGFNLYNRLRAADRVKLMNDAKLTLKLHERRVGNARQKP